MPRWKRRIHQRRRKRQSFVVMGNTDTGDTWIEKHDAHFPVCPLPGVQELAAYRERSQAERVRMTLDFSALPPVIAGGVGRGQTCLTDYLDVVIGWMGDVFTRPWKIAYYRGWSDG